MKMSVLERSLLTPSYGPAFVVGHAEQQLVMEHRGSQMSKWGFGALGETSVVC